MSIKVVVDTNVLISGVLVPHGPSAEVVRALQTERVQLILSEHLLNEFQDVITRPRIARKYPVAFQHAQILVDFLRATAWIVDGQPHEAVVTDPDDDFVLAAAYEGQAAYIISGDAHLLDLHEYRQIPIWTPLQFVNWLKSVP